MAIVSRPLSEAGRAAHERIFGKRKKCQKGKYSLDSKGGNMVKCKSDGGPYIAKGLKEGVAKHVVPHTHQEIHYKGNMQDFKDEVQRAYDAHPDPAFHGKVHLDNV